MCRFQCRAFLSAFVMAFQKCLSTASNRMVPRAVSGQYWYKKSGCIGTGLKMEAVLMLKNHHKLEIFYFFYFNFLR